eukprot:TRINITY_DN2653_c0_g4_i1.p1 TRINITY_DN2653_c0_g4~~TRINITY_DN2653_c0_g4_i1.p1  ORF type:complete len:148 (+),score=17.63 TRINITY_DN2653_c0_g4_i1:185-628(+)
MISGECFPLLVCGLGVVSCVCPLVVGISVLCCGQTEREARSYPENEDFWGDEEDEDEELQFIPPPSVKGVGTELSHRSSRPLEELELDASLPVSHSPRVLRIEGSGRKGGEQQIGGHVSPMAVTIPQSPARTPSGVIRSISGLRPSP